MSGKTLINQTIRLVPKVGHVPVEVAIPSLEVRPVVVSIPWTIKDGVTTSLVRWPFLRCRDTQVAVPRLSQKDGHIMHVVEAWTENVLQYSHVRIQGQISHYQLEEWYELRVVYVTQQMMEKVSRWEPYFEFQSTPTSFFERVSLSLFGGQRKEMGELRTKYNLQGDVEEIWMRVGGRVQINGLSRLIPKLVDNLQLGSIYQKT